MARTLLLKSLLIALALLPSIGLTQELFGAFAYSAKERKHGWANNYPSRKAAEQAALDQCRKNAADCQSILWFRNACGALVTGPDAVAADWAEDQNAAVNKALKTCAAKSTSCALTQSFCTGK